MHSVYVQDKGPYAIIGKKDGGPLVFEFSNFSV